MGSFKTLGTAPITTDARVTKALSSTSIRVSSSKSSTSSERSIPLSKSSKRSLKAAGLTENRLETIATIDFKPLYSAGNLTLAGDLFNKRVLKRASEIELLMETLTGLEESMPDELAAAVNQYNSSLIATEADFALLKTIVVLRRYAELSTQFISFLDEYSPNEEILPAVAATWNSVKWPTMMTGMTGVNFLNFNEWPKQASTVLMGNLLSALNCTSYGLSPAAISAGAYQNCAGSDCVLTKVLYPGSDDIAALYGLSFISRDLTLSSEMAKIRDDGEYDEDFKTLIEEVLGSTFATSTIKQSVKNLMAKFTGLNSFSGVRTGLSGEIGVATSPVTTLLAGAEAGLFGVLEYPYSSTKSVLVTESAPVELGVTTTGLMAPKSFNSLEPLIDDAFIGDNLLNFEKYDEASSNLVEKCKNLNTFGKIGFRLLDSKLDGGSLNTEIPLIAEQNPIAPQSIGAIALDVFSRKFVEPASQSLYTPFYEWLTPEHVAYTRNYAWALMRENPDRAKAIVGAFIKDIETGFLTVRELPESIEGTGQLDEYGREVEGTETVNELTYVLPETESIVNLLGRNTFLNGQLVQLNNYYKGIDISDPSWILSSYVNSAIGFPMIRTNLAVPADDVISLFGKVQAAGADTDEDGTSSSTEAITDLDLRLINPMSCVYREVDFSDSAMSSWAGMGIPLNPRTGPMTTTTTLDYSDTAIPVSNHWLGTKIVAAEIIDAVMEVLRATVTPFAEVEATADGDTMFPQVSGMKTPYGNESSSAWVYSGVGYDQFQMDAWVPTVLAWKKAFTREADETTFLRDAKIKDHAERIIDIFTHLMEPYRSITVKKTSVNAAVDSTTAAVGPGGIYEPLCVTLKFNEAEFAAQYSVLTGDKSGGSEAGIFHPSFMNVLAGTAPNITGKILNGTWPLAETIDPLTSGTGWPLIFAQWGGYLDQAWVQDQSLSLLYDLLGEYATRVEGYKTSFLDMLEGDESVIGDFVKSLVENGDSGVDVIENLGFDQLALKQLALDEEQGDETMGYLPNLSIISANEARSVRTLCDNSTVKSPEADNVKVVFVGVPAGTFEKHGIQDSFKLRASYVDIEYPQLVFKPKYYSFDKNLFILPSDIDSATHTTLTSMLNSMSFSKIKFEINESEDNTPEISLSDDVESVSTTSVSSDVEVYKNLLISELLKIYYRIVLGVNMSEISFPTTAEGLDLPVSDATLELATSMAEQLDEVSSFSESVAENIKEMLSDITTFENPDDFISGDITAVDSSLLNDIANAYQSRLFSSEVMRSRVLSAKMFDRIYAIPVDPDEFEIIPPGGAELYDAATPVEIFDYYYNAGIIEGLTDAGGSTSYKLSSRKAAEGTMAIGKVSFMLVSGDAETPTTEGLFGL